MLLDKYKAESIRRAAQPKAFDIDKVSLPSLVDESKVKEI